MRTQSVDLISVELCRRNWTRTNVLWAM